MSLVNDALRRAKEAQQQATPPPVSPLQFRPIEPGQHARRNLGLLVPVLLALLALLTLFAIWQWAQGNKTSELRQARALTPAAPQRIAPSPATIPTPAPASQPSLVQKPAPRPAPAISAPTTVAAVPPVEPVATAIAADPTNQVTGAEPVASSPAPKAPPLRLQAIVYDPKRPSALISGKTVFIGEKVGDSRVVAIDQESATLVSGGKTNVLSLLD